MKRRNKKLRVINVENQVYKWLLSSYSKELKIWREGKLIYDRKEHEDAIITPKDVEERILNLKLKTNV